MSADNLSTLAGNRRDPRVNPKAGDVLLKGGSERRIVDAIQRTSYPNGAMTGLRWQKFRWSRFWFSTNKSWRKWAATAEVIHNADDDATTSPVAQQSGEESSEGL